MDQFLPFTYILLLISSLTLGFPFLEHGLETASSGTASASVSAPTWSPSQLVDVAGSHAYHDPLPGQARGPCPAQNALANRGYLDRSGFTTFADCVIANTNVFNLGGDFASLLYFIGIFTGGGLDAVTFSLGNSTAVQNTITSACPTSGLLGVLLSPLCIVQNFLNQAADVPGFGLAQTNSAFEGDSSFLQPDWETTNGMDALTTDMSAFNKLWTKRLTDGTFDDYQIIVDWASYRKSHSIANNPCYFRAPFATVAASLGAYTFVPGLFANFTPEHPDGTLTGSTLASFFSVALENGIPIPKGLGKEQIPNNWYHRPSPFTVAVRLEKLAPILENDPTLLDMGGNTNGVNTFTGMDIGNLTGGVVNGQNLLQGDNFACFCYRTLQIALLDKLPNAAGAGLAQLGATLGEVIDTIYGKLIQSSGGVAGCPKFNYTELHNYTQYCGIRQQLGGILGNW